MVFYHYFVAESIYNVARGCYICAKGYRMKKNISMSVRVSVDELERLKKAAAKLDYSSYSEFVRRTALLEASKILKDGA